MCFCSRIQVVVTSIMFICGTVCLSLFVVLVSLFFVDISWCLCFFIRFGFVAYLMCFCSLIDAIATRFLFIRVTILVCYCSPCLYHSSSLAFLNVCVSSLVSLLLLVLSASLLVFMSFLLASVYVWHFFYCSSFSLSVHFLVVGCWSINCQGVKCHKSRGS